MAKNTQKSMTTFLGIILGAIVTLSFTLKGYSQTIFSQGDNGVPSLIQSLKSEDEDRRRIQEAQGECLYFKNKLSHKKFQVQCGQSYFHYQSLVNSQAHAFQGTLKIAEFNFFHPGSLKTQFKDYRITAQIANRFDVIAATELLPLMGTDLSFNQSLYKFLAVDGPKLMAKLQSDLIKRNADTNAIKLRMQKLKMDLEAAPMVFKLPGYLKILMELKKLDASWSLVLSPRGDSFYQGSVEEYVGFYYRASKVTLNSNAYCHQFVQAQSEACLVSFRDQFSNPQWTRLFSRRPMIASFKSGNFQFHYMTSHVAFNSPSDEIFQNWSIKLILGHDFNGDYDQIGMGVNSVNYARFLEMMAIARFMNGFQRFFPNEKILYGGDTNLDFKLNLWNAIRNELGAESSVVLSGDQKSTLTERRFGSKKEETLGVANSYDHFFYSKNQFQNCGRTQVFNFLNNDISTSIKTKYFIRDDHNLIPETTQYVLSDSSVKNPIVDVADDSDENEEPEEKVLILNYKLTNQNKVKMDKILGLYDQHLKSEIHFKNNQLYQKTESQFERLESFKVRLLLKQLSDQYFYKVYKELVSDHLPISMECSI